MFEVNGKTYYRSTDALLDIGEIAVIKMSDFILSYYAVADRAELKALYQSSYDSVIDGAMDLETIVILIINFNFFEKSYDPYGLSTLDNGGEYMDSSKSTEAIATHTIVINGNTYTAKLAAYASPDATFATAATTSIWGWAAYEDSTGTRVWNEDTGALDGSLTD